MKIADEIIKLILIIFAFSYLMATYEIVNKKPTSANYVVMVIIAIYGCLKLWELSL